MQNVLITGVSSGIGNTLSGVLIRKGFKVWGIARRKKILKELSEKLQNHNFFYTTADVSEEKFWDKLIKELDEKKFRPDIIIFNAAIYENDLKEDIDLYKLRKMMEINFFSVLRGVKIIKDHYNNKLHFITLSSTSAFKGSGKEGIGYAASKSSLSVAFESLFQKYCQTGIFFTTVFLGPVKTDMLRFTKFPLPMTLSSDQVAKYILRAIKEKKPFYYYPKITFMILSIMRLLPKQMFFSIWTIIQKSYIKE